MAPVIIQGNVTAGRDMEITGDGAEDGRDRVAMAGKIERELAQDHPDPGRLEALFCEMMRVSPEVLGTVLEESLSRIRQLGWVLTILIER